MPHAGPDPCPCSLRTASVPGTDAASLPVQDRNDQGLRDHCFLAVVVQLHDTAVSRNCEFNSPSPWETWTRYLAQGCQSHKVLPMWISLSLFSPNSQADYPAHGHLYVLRGNRRSCGFCGLQRQQTSSRPFQPMPPPTRGCDGRAMQEAAPCLSLWTTHSGSWLVMWLCMLGRRSEHSFPNVSWRGYKYHPSLTHSSPRLLAFQHLPLPGVRLVGG